MQTRSERILATGALLSAVMIWAGWMVETRLLSLGMMTPFDLAALRFAFAAVVLFPVILKKGPVVQSLGKSLALTATLGAPYVLVCAYGMRLTPASQASAIINGTMVAASSVLGVVLLKETFSPTRLAGLMVLIGGLALLIFTRASGNFNFGHLVFAIGGLLWSTYTVLAKRWKADPIHSTAVVAVYSAIFYLPVYLVFLKPTLSTLPASTLLVHGFYQGALVSGAALFLFSFGVSKLGAARASLFMPLVPLVTMILGAVYLHENPSQKEMIATGLILSGLILSALRFTAIPNFRNLISHVTSSVATPASRPFFVPRPAVRNSIAHVAANCAGQSRKA